MNPFLLKSQIKKMRNVFMSWEKKRFFMSRKILNVLILFHFILHISEIWFWKMGRTSQTSFLFLLNIIKRTKSRFFSGYLFPVLGVISLKKIIFLHFGRTNRIFWTSAIVRPANDRKTYFPTDTKWFLMNLIKRKNVETETKYSIFIIVFTDASIFSRFPVFFSFSCSFVF